jgi:hypothetical protein
MEVDKRGTRCCPIGRYCSPAQAEAITATETSSASTIAKPFNHEKEFCYFVLEVIFTLWNILDTCVYRQLKRRSCVLETLFEQINKGDKNWATLRQRR